MRSSRKFLAVVLLVILAATLLTAFALADGAQAAEAPARSITCTTCDGTGTANGAECDVCGGEVTLFGFTNTCPTCEERGITTDYNASGQLLAPRSQWGEETGETAADILRGGDDE